MGKHVCCLKFVIKVKYQIQCLLISTDISEINSTLLNIIAMFENNNKGELIV